MKALLGDAAFVARPHVGAPKNKSTSEDAGLSKTEGGEPSGYSRGEGQKPVSKAYKDNWNVIFAKKKMR
jgi:hypothetical protein